MKKEELIGDVLLLPIVAMDYYISRYLTSLFPQKAVLELAGSLNVEGYARQGKCKIIRSAWSHNQVSTYWRAPESELLNWSPRGMHSARMRAVMMGGNDFVAASQMQEGKDMSARQDEQETADLVKKAWLEIEWEGVTLDLLVLNLELEGSFRMQSWLLADSEEKARAFIASIGKWSAELRSEVLVFDNGHWHKDERLYQNIQGASFDNLVLQGNLKQEIREDLANFFASRAVYEEHDIPWKRGILFIGPAGNGKTHMVKALINSLSYPCLYVRSFRAPHTQGADEINIQQVFEQARRTAPCLLVLEDLDSLITPQNRSFFLNELDGFAANIGIVALATTNHPERLDPSILDRPSRFDRKYHFNLPNLAERQGYITMWNTDLKPALQLSPEGAVKIGELTADFSFAYLKELFLSSKMRWIASGQQRTMDEIMTEQAQTLREQMTSAQTMISPPELPDDPF